MIKDKNDTYNKKENIYPFIYNGLAGKEEMKQLKKDKDYRGIFFNAKNKIFKQFYNLILAILYYIFNAHLKSKFLVHKFNIIYLGKFIFRR